MRLVTLTAAFATDVSADDSQYAIMWDLELFPQLEADHLRHSPVSELSLNLSMVCLIDCDVGQSP